MAEVKITFLNVGYGDAVLLEARNGGEPFRILVDGGIDDPEHYRGHPHRIRACDYLSACSVDRLDILVITHLHGDHVAGLLEVVRRVEVGEVWCNYLPEEDMDVDGIDLDASAPEGSLRLASALSRFGKILTHLRRKGVRIVEKDRTELGVPLFPGVAADVFCEAPGEMRLQKELIRRAYSGLGPAEVAATLGRIDSFVNQTSLVLRIKAGGKAVLLGGDVGADFWAPLLARGQDISADILKMPHHGHGDAASPEFARGVNPGFVVVSVSDDRSDGCPNPRMLEVFSEAASDRGKVLRFFFTDSVKLEPFADGSEKHRAIVFVLEEGRNDFLVRRIP